MKITIESIEFDSNGEPVKFPTFSISDGVFTAVYQQHHEVEDLSISKTDGQSFEREEGESDRDFTVRASSLYKEMYFHLARAGLPSFIKRATVSGLVEMNKRRLSRRSK